MLENANRLIRLLRLVPRRAPGITALDMVGKLEAEGTRVHLRTVQRDLQALAVRYPLVADGKPLRWRWLEGAPEVHLPRLDVTGAVVWASIALHMRAMLPPDLLDEVDAQFSEAFQVLRGEKRGRGIWPRRIVRISSGMPLRPPPIKPEIYRMVASCLADRRCLIAKYRPRGADSSQSMNLHPLGLVLRDHLTYLVAARDGDELPIQLALHRFEDVTASPRGARDPEGFDLAAYASGSAFGYPVGSRIRVHLRFSAEAGFHLTEATLAEDQRIRRLDSGEYDVTATLEDTQQLRWWLRAFGDQVEVLKPARLRREIAAHAVSLAQIYARR